MSPEACACLMDVIRPILKAVVPRVVTPIGSESFDELIQDGLCDAARAIDSMERSGKTLLPRSVAHYTLQHLKTGRRMLDSGISDVYSTMRRVNNGGGVVPFDEPIEFDDPDGPCVGDALCDRKPDPSEEAGRRIDWGTMLERLDKRQRRIVEEMAAGTMSIDIGRMLGVSPARVTQMKSEIAAEIKKVMGDDILAEMGRESAWERDLRCLRERRESRFMNAND